MSDLANYSIETDHTVLLLFKDGRKLRVSLGQLAQHLKPADLAKITRALELRRTFINRHMPKVVLVVVAGGLIALSAAATSRIVAWIQHRPATPAPAPESPGNAAQKIVRDAQSAAPAPTPAQSHATKNKPIAARGRTKPAPTPVSGQRSSRKAAGVAAGKSATQLSTPLGSVTLPVTLPAPLSTVLPLSPIVTPAPDSSKPTNNNTGQSDAPSATDPVTGQVAPLTKGL